MKKKKEYFIVDREILPTSIQKVIEVNDLIQSEKISKYEAIQKVGISRSTYYKYKDYIRPFFESGRDTVFNLYLLMDDHPGILSSILDVIAKSNLNILTIIQNIPIDNLAAATISLQAREEKLRDIEITLEEIRGIDGVKDLRIIGNN
ncbi:MAG: chorismate mutase [Fusobacteriaceae bacterium]|jgi:chorismate mutase|nr:amino acid-binding domain protein [Fusobacteriales bacterium]MDN5304241.1 chorismate mutase [Fusobacteriaceae bacterium]